MTAIQPVPLAHACEDLVILVSALLETEIDLANPSVRAMYARAVEQARVSVAAEGVTS